MSNIDKHAVQAVADLKAGYTLGHADVAILNELARIALASLEAEAVCVIDQSNLDYLKSGSDADVWPASRTEMGDVLLYRAAPSAPVSVPDEVNVLLNHLEDVLPDDAFNLIDVKTWNNVSMLSRPDVYRSAMLHGAEPVTTAYKLPEGWVAVPVEPTEEMIAAAMCSNDVLFDKEDDTLFRVQHGEIWRAMLSTAPQQEVKP
ncbi:hypothetical protein [Enterobacter hormaechei]|uniref:hypothetical protein n=1 Tax=Enterobacter hormaechei TaxID=158836 RepID=UPI00289334B6|nr:hypothetical protein [Enterobacter hormaechei]WMA54808.1 hypothetical protein QPR81_09365 [Enterobacter hormaechei]